MGMDARKHALHDMKKHHTRLPEAISKPRSCGDSCGDRTLHEACRPQTPRRILYPNLNATSARCESSENTQEEAESLRWCQSRSKTAFDIGAALCTSWLAGKHVMYRVSKAWLATFIECQFLGLQTTATAIFGIQSNI
jgi:hypothetical protein